VSCITQSDGATIGAMLGRTYDSQTCSVARTLELIGERWTPLIIRDAFLGVRRFGDFAERLGIARNVLQDRLERLVEAGVLDKTPYQERPLRHEYRLTPMGRDLWPVIVTLLQFGDRHLTGSDGAPMLLLHRGCGGELDDRRMCRRCGAALELGDVEAQAGPGGARVPNAA
jgi:DNA-binding HxlR family transcriptional regulator